MPPGAYTPTRESAVTLSAELHAGVGVGKALELFGLPLVVALDARGGLLQRVANRSGLRLERFAPAVVVEQQRAGLSMFETFDVAAHCRVALVANCGEDFAYRGLYALEIALAAARQPLELALEIGRAHRGGAQQLRRPGHVQ